MTELSESAGIDPEEIVSLEACAFSEHDRRRIHLALLKVNGLIICSGPADSGKRTTLYACTQHANHPQRKVVAIERRPRGDLALATRLQVAEAEVGELGPLMLRGAMHAEADVIMLEDMAAEALFPLTLRAALTRHLVLGRLPAQDTADAYAWTAAHNSLPFHITDVIRLIIHQRLLPRLCAACSHPQGTDRDDEAWLTQVAELHGMTRGDLPTRYYVADGCDACQGSASPKRLLIAELLPGSDKLTAAVREQMPFARLRGYAFAEQLTRHMALDAVEKAAEGLVSLAAVRRALHDDPYLPATR